MWLEHGEQGKVVEDEVGEAGGRGGAGQADQQGPPRPGQRHWV